MFQPEEIANNLREHGSFIPGIRPGQKTAEYLNNVLTRDHPRRRGLPGAASPCSRTSSPDTGMTRPMQYFLGGTSVLIVVGVALELVDRLNAQLVMRNYEGFMKSKGLGGRGLDPGRGRLMARSS